MKNIIKDKLNPARIRIFSIFLASVFAFYIFGKSNIIVGLGSVLIATTMFGQDYTADMATNVKTIALINLMLGVFSYIAAINPWTMLFSTFVVSFFVYYLFNYDAKPSKSIGFISLYILMAYFPVGIEMMASRLLALAFSGLAVMMVYSIVSKYNFEDAITAAVKDALGHMKIQGQETGSLEERKAANRSANMKLKELELRLYERMEMGESKVKSLYLMDMVVILLKRMNQVMASAKDSKTDMVILQSSAQIVGAVSDLLCKNQSADRLKDQVKRMSRELSELEFENATSRYNYYNFKSLLEEFCECVENVDAFVEVYAEKKTRLMKAVRKEKYDIRKNVKRVSKRFTLAMKASFLLSFSMFLVAYFHIRSGSWAVFTIAILLLPYSEQSNKKALDRVAGTVIGALSFNLINMVISQNAMVIAVLMVVFLYVSMAVNSYRTRCVFTTFNSLLAVRMMSPSASIAFMSAWRVGLIVAGAAVTSIMMNSFFPYGLKDDVKNMVSRHIELNRKVLEKFQEGCFDREELRRIITINNYLWRRINYNNKELKSKDVDGFLSSQNDFTMDCGFLIRRCVRDGVDRSLIVSVSNSFSGFDDDETLKGHARRLFNDAKDDVHRLVIVHLYRIYSGFINMNRLQKSAYESMHLNSA